MILGPSLFTWVKKAPSPTGLASAIISIGVSESDRCIFNSMNASFCSFPNTNGVPAFVRHLRGSEIVARSGMNLPQ